MLACKNFQDIKGLTTREEDMVIAVEHAIQQGARIAQRFRKSTDKKVTKRLKSKAQGQDMTEEEMFAQQAEASLSQSVAVWHRKSGFDDRRAEEAAELEEMKLREEQQKADDALTAAAGEKHKMYVRGGGTPLSEDRVLSSHLRRLTRQKAEVQRENERIAHQLYEFVNAYHSDDYKEEKILGGTLEIHIGGAHFVRDPDVMTIQERSLVKHHCSCMIVGRGLADFKTRMSTPPQKEISHPVWDFDGELKDFHDGESIQFQIRDLNGYQLIAYKELKSNIF